MPVWKSRVTVQGCIVTLVQDHCYEQEVALKLLSIMIDFEITRYIDVNHDHSLVRKAADMLHCREHALKTACINKVDN